MTPREGFKYGFLLRCAEEGLTVKEAEARAARGLEKQAEEGFASKVLSDIYDTGKSWITGVPKYMLEYGPQVIGAGALGAAGVGAAGGYGLAKMQEGDVDPEEIQREELISAYKTQSDLARRKAIMEAAQSAWPRPRSHHGI